MCVCMCTCAERQRSSEIFHHSPPLACRTLSQPQAVLSHTARFPISCAQKTAGLALDGPTLRALVQVSSLADPRHTWTRRWGGADFSLCVLPKALWAGPSLSLPANFPDWLSLRHLLILGKDRWAGGSREGLATHSE